MCLWQSVCMRLHKAGRVIKCLFTLYWSTMHRAFRPSTATNEARTTVIWYVRRSFVRSCVSPCLALACTAHTHIWKSCSMSRFCLLQFEPSERQRQLANDTVCRSTDERLNMTFVCAATATWTRIVWIEPESGGHNHFFVSVFLFCFCSIFSLPFYCTSSVCCVCRFDIMFWMASSSFTSAAAVLCKVSQDLFVRLCIA